MLALLPLLFSGFAGVGWQLLWVRAAGLVLGGTVPAVSLVVATFLAGLGIGARLGGVHADRHPSTARRAYAACELFVAAWGLATLPGLTFLADRGLGATAPGADDWWAPTPAAHLLQLAFAVVLVGPPTLAMGASIPLLGRPLAHRSALPDLAAAMAVANTLGAILSALLVDTILVPGVGRVATAILLAIAGTAAARFATKGAPGSPVPRADVEPTTATLHAPARGSANATNESRVSGPGPALDEASAGGGVARTTGESGVSWPRTGASNAADRNEGPSPTNTGEFAEGWLPDAVAGIVAPDEARRSPALPLVAAGFVAMGLEVLQTRFLGSALGPYRAVFAMILAVSLTGWALGAALAARLPARWTAPALAAAQASVGILAFAGFLAHDPETLLRRQLAWTSGPGQLLTTLVTVATVVAPAALAMGAVLPLTARLFIGTPGRTLGRLWQYQTLGNAAGALLTGLLVLPALGLQTSAFGLALLAALAATSVHRASAGALALVAPLLLLPPDRLLWASFPANRIESEGVLDVREGVEQTVVVTGSADGPARLWTNGHPMSSTTAHAQRYMRLMAHLPLLAQEAPRRALVICFGVGNTLHAASLHPLESLWIADTSRDVLSVSNLFAHANHGVLADPRVTVHLDDGRHVLARIPAGTLDLVTLEPPPIAHANVAALYSREFYRSAHERLAPGGWITQWLPAYQVPADTVRSLVATFLDVFPGAVLLVGDDRELILAGVRDGVPTLDTVPDRLASRPAVAADLARLELDVSDLVLTFGASTRTLAAVTRGAPLVTDDQPLLERAQQSHIMDTRLPEGLLDPSDIEAFAPGLVDAEIREKAMANAARWRAEAFMRFSNRP